jgi:hypothetical protein
MRALLYDLTFYAWRSETTTVTLTHCVGKIKSLPMQDEPGGDIDF